jgi:hypothetical protein
MCTLVACGSSEAPTTAAGNTDDVLGDSAATGELPEWHNDDTIADDTDDGSTAAPEDADGRDASIPDDAVAADADDAGADEDTDTAPPPDITDDTTSSPDITDDTTSSPDITDDITPSEDTTDDIPDTLDDSSGVATCAGVPIEPWRCPDGELIDYCTCVEDFLVCEEDPFPRCAAAQCWDGQPLTCRALPPVCPEEQQVTLQDGCWRCVDPIACVPPEISCINNGGFCGNARIGCGADAWISSDYECQFSGTGAICCLPGRDASCDDGSEPLCDRIPPVCDSSELLAVQGSCYSCVNPATCAPWGEPTCRSGADCGFDSWCNPCGTSSCSGCRDCVAACVPHGCETESVLFCRCPAPDCTDAEQLTVIDGCWACTEVATCEITFRGCGELPGPTPFP